MRDYPGRFVFTLRFSKSCRARPPVRRRERGKPSVAGPWPGKSFGLPLRFWLDAEGKVVDVQQRHKSLMETFRNVRANGADLDPKTGVRMPRRE